MAILMDAANEGMIEECLERLDEAIDVLERFPDVVVAHALRIHLGALLSVILERGVCTRGEAADFLADLSDEALHERKSD